MRNVCLWLISNFFLPCFVANSLYLKWVPNQSRKTKFKHWSETKQESNYITAAFQDTLIILFQCILFYSYFNIALNFPCTEHVSFLETSVWVWRGALCLSCCNLEDSDEKSHSEGGNSSPGSFSWHTWPAIWPCVQMITVLLMDFRIAVQRAPHIFSSAGMSAEKVISKTPLFLSIAHVCSELWPPSACGCSQIQALIRLAIARAEHSSI